MNFWKMAELWHKLMTEYFGYRRYAAAGSDYGALVCLTRPLTVLPCTIMCLPSASLTWRPQASAPERSVTVRNPAPGLRHRTDSCTIRYPRWSP
jgi:hypothetical protein